MVVTKMGRIVSTICNNTIQERRSCPRRVRRLKKMEPIKKESKLYEDF